MRISDWSSDVGASGSIGAPVRMIGQELIEQIAVGGMDLDPVEAGDDSLLGGIGEARQRHIDLFVAHGDWGAIGACAAIEIHLTAFRLHRGWPRRLVLVRVAL